jgi:hypothetical protein
MEIHPSTSYVKIDSMEGYHPVMLRFSNRLLIGVTYSIELPSFVTLQLEYDMDGNGIAIVPNSSVECTYTEDEMHSIWELEDIDNNLLRVAIG